VTVARVKRVRAAVAMALLPMACGGGRGSPAAPSPPAGPAAPVAVLSWDHIHVPIVVGHRGSGNVTAPENTFAAFDSAVAAGAAIETDVRSTRDGVLVLMHDETVDRTTGTPAGKVSALTYEQLRALDASRVHRPEVFSPQAIPTFEEYLRRYGRRLLLPEIKGNAADAEAMARLIQQYGLVDSVLVQSFTPALLRVVKGVDSAIRTAITSGPRVRPEAAAANGAWAVLVSAPEVTADYVASMHATGIKVFAWTVNSPAVADAMRRHGVDGILSDDPRLAVAHNLFHSPIDDRTGGAP